MHILYVHRNFPAQFGQIAAALAAKPGWHCTYVSEKPAGHIHGIECIQYRVAGLATPQTHFCARTFENTIWHSHAIYEALAARPDIAPDLVVGHAGAVSTMFLRQLYDCPHIGYFEYFYGVLGTDFDFRPKRQLSPLERMRAQARNASILLDLHHCDAGTSPTQWQRSLLPLEYQSKVSVIFDGVDTSLWRPIAHAPRIVAGRTLPPDTRVVTYVARGFESIRGFDIFMQIAKRVCLERPDVVFVVVGQDRVFYGSDDQYTSGKSFRDWVLSQDSYDLARIWFVGTMPPAQLAMLWAISDLHIYLTEPFVVSWSLLNALACGVPVLASDTGPVKEIIQHGISGLLNPFFDVDGFVGQTLKVLENPHVYLPLGTRAIEIIENRYQMDVCRSTHVHFYENLRSRWLASGPNKAR